MPKLHTSPLSEFHKYVGLQLEQADAPPMSPEEALARWREHQETLAAIREGLADIDAGRTRLAEDVIADLRARLPMP